MHNNIPPLYNYEIEEYLAKFKLPYFKGVYSSDNLPKIDNDCIIICNLSDSIQPGSHFVTICKIGGVLFFLDSLALNVGNENLIRFLESEKSKSVEFCYINSPMQSYNSDSCGIYCIFFVLLYHVAANRHSCFIKMKKFAVPEINDYICIHNINVLARCISQKI